MPLDPLGLSRREQTASDRKRQGEHNPESDRFAVQQPAGKPRRCFERMTESMAQIEQSPLAKLALIPRHDRRFHTTAHRDRVLARGAAGEQLSPIALQPREEIRIRDQSVFDDLGIAGAEFASRQRVQKRGIGEDQYRLVKGADQILSMARVDGSLAADRGINLRKQRRRNLHVIKATANNRSGETGASTVKLFDFSPAGTVMQVEPMPAPASADSVAAR